MCVHSTSSELLSVVHKIRHGESVLKHLNDQVSEYWLAALKSKPPSAPSNVLHEPSNLSLMLSVRGNILAALSLSKGHRF
jgi:hypothetical protein